MDLIFEGTSGIPWAGNWHGREGWGKFFQTLGENLDDIRVTMEPFAAQGDNVAAAGPLSGARQADRPAD
ncbi:MAG TPA: nuclear transport factor 2 family protein [Chloroflexota bacterium]|nr:nuclear transport factor 2 family protein [Chloroflexota bacterium]